MSVPTAAFKSEDSLTVKRRSYVGHDPSAISKIYQEEVNISIWQRKLDDTLKQAVEPILYIKPQLQLSEVIQPQDVNELLSTELGSSQDILYLCKDISALVHMFCYLFDLQRTGLRLMVLDHAMCPRFHVDKVPCRLITTYRGLATEWLPHHLVDRSKLGAGNQGKADEESGIFAKRTDIEQLEVGHVALLKGEGWDSNQGAGLVHRSPKLEKGGQRLLLTLDFVDG